MQRKMVAEDVEMKSADSPAAGAGGEVEPAKADPDTLTIEGETSYSFPRPNL